MTKRVYPKQPCPKCGKEISTAPLAWSNHKIWHVRHDNPEPQPPPNSAVRETESTQPAAQPTGEPATDQPKVKSMNDPLLKERIARARRVQERFLRSPDAFVAADTSDEFLEARKTYLPDSLPVVDPTTGRVVKPATEHEFFCEKNEIDVYVDRGYTPVLDERGEHHVLPNGMAMMNCPQDLFDKRERRARTESQRMVKQSAGKMSGRPRSVEAVDNGGVNEEENRLESMSVEELNNG